VLCGAVPGGLQVKDLAPVEEELQRRIMKHFAGESS
jgi:hypothetical protein